MTGVSDVFNLTWHAPAEEDLVTHAGSALLAQVADKGGP